MIFLFNIYFNIWNKLLKLFTIKFFYIQVFMLILQGFQFIH